MTSSDAELGKAWKAFFTFNHRAKKNRLDIFEPKRWLAVVKAVNGGINARVSAKALSSNGNSKKITKRKWSSTQREKYYATLNKRHSK